MKFELQLPTGTFTTRDSFVRKLEHPSGPVYILDQVFDPSFVESLYAVLANVQLLADEYDSDAGPRIRHLKCEFPAEALIAGETRNEQLLARLPKGKGATHLSAVARITLHALEKLYPNYSDLKIGRIHVNSVPHGDMLSTHEDGWPGASLTGLYFANANWHSGFQGELILCDPLGESMYAIEPRPGRFVLFPGEIPHRAGAPSRICFDHRLSLAHKFRAVREGPSG